jgi:hypothetical protein
VLISLAGDRFENGMIFLEGDRLDDLIAKPYDGLISLAGDRFEDG